MKRILLISEKRAQAQAISAALSEHEIINNDSLIDYVFVMPMSWWHYKIPSHISMADIPFSQTPRLENLAPNPTVSSRKYNEPDEKSRSNFWLFSLDAKFRHCGYFTGMNGERMLSSSKIISPKSNLTIDTVIPEIASRIDNYDQIIVAPDSDHSGWTSAFRFMEMLDREIKHKHPDASFFASNRNIRGLWMHEGLDTESLFRSYSEETPLTDSRIQTARTIGDAKRIFDYWWFYNSAAVFTKVLRDVGVPSLKIISKYELMFLHLLRQWGKPIRTLDVFKSMEAWLGTGKYRQYEVFHKPNKSGFEGMCLSPSSKLGESPNRAEMIWGQIGSAMSRSAIIDNLKEMGLVDVTPLSHGEEVSISHTGNAFLGLCHKATFDPDLPFRLAVWCQNQEYDKMARYIRTVFGKQKRYLSKLSSTNKAI